MCGFINWFGHKPIRHAIAQLSFGFLLLFGNAMVPGTVLISILLLSFVSNAICKIVLPHKLRYLENMLNAEVIVKAAKLRQRMEANPNVPDSEKSWPVLLAKYQADEKHKNHQTFGYKNTYGRRIPNLK